MMRTKTEIQLLTCRQALKDALDYLRNLEVVPIEEYRVLYCRFETCNQMLWEYRQDHKYNELGA